MPFALDSSALLETLYDTARGKSAIDFFGEQHMIITSIALYEIFTGKKPHEEKAIKMRLADAEILVFDEKAAEESALIEKELKSAGKMINQMDTLIAGICKSNKMSIITSDKDFEKIKGLRVKVVA